MKNVVEFGALRVPSSQVILVSSLREFLLDYLAAIPVDMPRLALIKSGAPVPAREQLDKLELDAYILTPV